MKTNSDLDRFLRLKSKMTPGLTSAQRTKNQPEKGHSSIKKKSKQPFPVLPAFLPAATLLSYFDYSDHVFTLLWQLSKTTKAYALDHSRILEHFVKVYEPPIKVDPWNVPIEKDED